MGKIVRQTELGSIENLRGQFSFLNQEEERDESVIGLREHDYNRKNPMQSYAYIQAVSWQ